MPLRAGALAFLCLLSAAPAAAALEPATISVSLNPDGSGRMVVNSRTNPPGEDWGWQGCHTGDACAPFAAGRIVDTDRAAPETTFKASSTLGATATSPVWHGKVSPATLPVVSGLVRAHELVTPVPGSWTGGWEGDRDVPELAACASPEGRDCIALTDPQYISSCANGAAVVDRLFTGRYLRVAAERHGRDEPVPSFAVSSPYGTNVMRAGPTRAVAIVGKIAPARGARQSDCGPAPLVCQSTAARSACRAAPLAGLSVAGGASVTCLSGCRMALVARHGRRSVRVARPVRAARPGTLRLTRRALRPLGVASVMVRLLVNDEERSRRVVTIQP